MTVATLRLGRRVPLSSYEFEQWRARDRAIAIRAQQAANRRAVQTQVRGRGRRGMGR